MPPRAEGSSAKSVPTFQYDGRFVGGISCGLSCQHRTITAQQSLAVTGEIKATVVPVVIDFWISPVVLDLKIDTFSLVLPAHLHLNVSYDLVELGGPHFILVRERGLNTNTKETLGDFLP